MVARVVPDGAAGRKAAAATLREGGVVAIPTDTVYGIAVALGAAAGVERLFEIKARPPDKAVMVLVDALDQLADWVELSAAANALAALWPGGLTLVLPLRAGAPLPAALTAGTQALGVRIPNHDVPRSLARAVGPIPTTSANLSGASEARSAQEVLATLGGRIDLIVDGGPSEGGVPSTVVDCSAGRPRILRLGAIGADRLAAVLDAAGLEHDLRP
ncbi:MAG: L-threonylcarbamoyladenylate synthase [Chloroflexota bacterium]|nr:L-threonylcarbamoyladenylate synthase [Chloroflexota bacterium]